MNAFLAALSLACAVPLAAPQSTFKFRDLSPTAIELTDNGKPVFVYNYGPVLAPGFPESMRRSGYLSPVYAPNGVVLTDDFNRDHPHHRGISWMWPEVTIGGKKGDMWQLTGFQSRFVRWNARETSGSTARLTVENGWFDGDRPFVKEEVDLVAHSVSGQQRVLEFTLRFEALDRPVQIAGTPEGKKGFGGFCMRFAPRDGGAAKTLIRTEKGIAKRDEVLSPHRWAEISGTFGGKAAGARIEDGPSNPGYPNNGWLIRHGFGFLNVSYPGLQPIAFEPGKPLVLTYRVVLLSGTGEE